MIALRVGNVRAAVVSVRTRHARRERACGTSWPVRSALLARATGAVSHGGEETPPDAVAGETGARGWVMFRVKQAYAMGDGACEATRAMNAAPQEEAGGLIALRMNGWVTPRRRKAVFHVKQAGLRMLRVPFVEIGLCRAFGRRAPVEPSCAFGMRARLLRGLSCAWMRTVRDGRHVQGARGAKRCARRGALGRIECVLSKERMIRLLILAMRYGFMERVLRRPASLKTRQGSGLFIIGEHSVRKRCAIRRFRGSNEPSLDAVRSRLGASSARPDAPRMLAGRSLRSR